MQRAVAVATPEVVRRPSVDRWFYIGMAIATIVTVVLGFGPSLVNTATRHAPLTPLAAAHTVVYGAWLLAFLTQTMLVATRRTSVHRRMGSIFMVLAPAMVVLGYMTAIAMGRRGLDLSGDLHIESDPLLGMINPLGDLLAFTVLVTAGFCYRRRPAIHKRLMLLATACLMPAPLAHFIGHVPALNAMPPPIILIPLGLLLFASAVYDRVSLGRVHPISLWVALAILGWVLLLNGAIGPSATWHHLAAWAIR
jgi:hypothetical protein